MEMDTGVMKERLHEYIETADNVHLAAMYLLLEKELQQADYDQETLKKLYERVEADLVGRSKSYTADEAFSLVRNKRL